MEAICDIRDRANFTVEFNDSPYEILNHTQFDVGNFEVNNFNNFSHFTTSVSFNIIQECSEDVRKAFTSWHRAIFDDFMSGPLDKLETTATLIMYDDNCKTLRKYSLNGVHPSNVSFGYSSRNKSLATITISASSIALREHDTIDKELEKEIYTKFNESVKENKDDKKDMMSLDNIKPIIKMLHDLDEIVDQCNNNDDLYDGDFIEAISDYKELLEYRCLEFVKDACK